MTPQEFFDMSDAYVLVCPNGNTDSPLSTQEHWQNVSFRREIEKNKPVFTVSPNEHYVNEKLIAFTRTGLL